MEHPLWRVCDGMKIVLASIVMRYILDIRSRVCPCGDYDRRELSRLGLFSRLKRGGTTAQKMLSKAAVC